MKTNILFIYILLFSIAAQANNLPGTVKVKKETVIEYVSLGNDFAEIKMEMFSNGTFKIIIQPKDGKALKLKGDWEHTGNENYILKFKKTQLAVNKLFNMNDPNRLQIVNDLNVKFSGHLSSLWIWGIQCKKSDVTFI